MKVSGLSSLARALAVLPAAGAEVACAPIRVIDCDTVTVLIQYVGAAAPAVGLGAPTIFPAWTFHGAIVRQGTMLVGGTLVREAYPFAGAGTVGGSIARCVELVVPAGAVTLDLNVAETGEIANPGFLAVSGAASM